MTPDEFGALGYVLRLNEEAVRSTVALAATAQVASHDPETSAEWERVGVPAGAGAAWFRDFARHMMRHAEELAHFAPLHALRPYFRDASDAELTAAASRVTGGPMRLPNDLAPAIRTRARGRFRRADEARQAARRARRTPRRRQ
jgi:hypothetical protein